MMIVNNMNYLTQKYQSREASGGSRLHFHGFSWYFLTD